MQTIIMLHGDPLSGKSTAAQKIKDTFEKNNINSKVIKSVVTRYKKSENIKFTRKSIDENIKNTKKEKDNAYRTLCLTAEGCKNDNVLILDATFHKYYRRKWIYDLNKRRNTKVIILWLEFNDEDGIKEFLKKRQKNHDFKDNILHTLEQYKTMVNQTDSIKDHEIKKNRKIKIIRFNRTKNHFKFYNCNESEMIISLICNALQN